MGTPSWLYHLFAALMLLVAAYNAVLLVSGLANRKLAGWDIDIAHILMGIAMAGMFVPSLVFGANQIWVLLFGILLIWFLARSVSSVQRYGLHVPHELIHAAMSFAMMLMYWYPASSGSGSSSMMGGGGAMGGASSAHLDPGISLLLAMVFFGSAIFTLASPYKGASHHGRHVIIDTEPSDDALGRAEVAVVVGVALPWLEDVSHAVMCVAMGFMLILMI